MRTATIKKLILTATAVVISGFFVLPAQQEAPPEIYTAAQAAAGRTAYESSCIKCHTDTLIPPAGAKYMEMEVPPLAGARFMKRWGARTTNELSRRVNEAVGGFPPKIRDEKTNLNLTAYILQFNGARPGTEDLTAATAVVIQKTTAAADSER